MNDICVLVASAVVMFRWHVRCADVDAMACMVTWFPFSHHSPSGYKNLTFFSNTYATLPMCKNLQINDGHC